MNKILVGHILLLFFSLGLIGVSIFFANGAFSTYHLLGIIIGLCGIAKFMHFCIPCEECKFIQ